MNERRHRAALAEGFAASVPLVAQLEKLVMKHCTCEPCASARDGIEKFQAAQKKITESMK